MRSCDGPARTRLTTAPRPTRRHAALFLLGALLSSLVTVGPGHFGITKVSASSAYESAVLADSPSAYYRLGESSGSTAADDSGNGNSATYGTGVTYGDTGALSGDSDTAIHQDGSHTPVTGSDSWTPTGHSGWTADGWVKSSSSSAALVLWGADTSTNQFMQLYESDAHHLQVSWSAGVDTFTTTADLSDANWHYLAWTSDGTTLDAMSMATQRSTTPTPGPRSSTLSLAHGGSGAWQIGVRAYTPSYDDVALYPSTLTAARINAHWAAGIAATNSSPSDTGGAYKTAVLPTVPPPTTGSMRRRAGPSPTTSRDTATTRPMARASRTARAAGCSEPRTTPSTAMAPTRPSPDRTRGRPRATRAGPSKDG